MKLSDLVGKHTLTGVDFLHEQVKQWSDHYADCQVINFTLDGVTYSAVEDPEDGYRSSMEELLISNTTVTNTFPGQEVLAKMRDDNRYETNDILDLIDLCTAKIVLSVGTANTNDYYPWFVAEFHPENMSINTANKTV